MLTLSKNLTFSLTLMMVLALAFIAVPSVLALDISLSIVDTDLSEAGNQGDQGKAADIQIQIARQLAADVDANRGVNVETSDVLTLKIDGSEVLVAAAKTDFVVIGGSIADDATFTRSGKGFTVPVAPTNNVKEMSVYLRPNTLAGVSGDNRHDAESLILKFVLADQEAPKVISVVRPSVERAADDSPIEATHPVIEDTFDLIITLSEMPEAFNAGHVAASNASVQKVYFLRTMQKMTAGDNPAPDPVINGTGYDTPTPDDYTGTDNKHYLYVATIKPNYAKTDDIKITIKKFNDMFGLATADPAQKENPVIKVDPSRIKKTAATAGTKVSIANDLLIPANGYLIVAKDDGMDNTNTGHPSHIEWPGGAKDSEATRDLRAPRLRTYNITEIAANQWKNLESFLRRGGTIDLISGHAVQISEIMWATDGGDDKRQWIEIQNTTDAELKTKDYALMFYESSESPPAVPADRVSTLDKGTYWDLLGIGQSGRTNGIIERSIGVGDDVDIDIEVVQTIQLISMQRRGTPDATTGKYPDGRMMSSWAASSGAPRNFVEASAGLLVGTPGTAPITPDPVVVVPEPEPVPDPTPSATESDIAITEIMVDTGGGRLPQWIELTNTSSAAVSLRGWNVVIDNAADADVYGGGAPITVSLGDVELGVGEGIGNGDGQGQSVLLVAWSARNSGNFNASRVVNLAPQLEQTGRYQLLSYNGFRITLVPEQTSPVLASGDDVGNLGMNWDIPMGEGGRSSLIRREMDNAGMATMGTSADGWKLASMTDLISGPTSWYGSDEDAGTPGYDSGGPLPVELSMFYPARDRLTGAVVITWETQSELNNAGFFIKRSEAKNGKFTVINPQMIAGAGTTSEKQSYTYTDTSAKPNVVYYYQIEDVSLDGQRQLLTIGTRLRGHIGAAGKLTTSWGELKKVQE